MKMFRMIALCSCAALFALLFSACGRGTSSSGGQSGSVPAQAASEPLPALSAPEEPAASAPAASEPEPDEDMPEPVAMNTVPSFVSLPVTEAGGVEGEKALVVLYVPESWSFDQYTAFSRGEIKIAEFPRLWRAPDGASPFSTEMLAPYQGGGVSPEDAVTADDLELDGKRLRVLHLQTWMNGAEDIWYLHCAFYVVDGYVVEAHLYTVQEWGGADSEELLAALRTLEVYSGGEEDAGT